jgi:hypothetical protein
MGEPSNKGMKQTKREHNGASQVIPGVRRLMPREGASVLNGLGGRFVTGRTPWNWNTGTVKRRSWPSRGTSLSEIARFVTSSLLA